MSLDDRSLAGTGGVPSDPAPTAAEGPVPCPIAPGDLAVEDLGRISYDEALAIQRSARDRLFAGREAGEPMRIFLLEHDPPVITVSRRPTAAGNVLASEAALARPGIERRETDRGGDVTYHGPGQVVAYAIFDLPRLGLRVTSHMRLLEQVVIDVIEGLGVIGRRDPSATGVWVGEGPAAGKIAAMGVRVGRGISMHGLALNVDPDLSHFGLIVPCGLAGRPVTSLARELGEACPTVPQAKAALEDAFRRRMTVRE
ncbi:MAG: lipoyl(octanoyl) transferase LipB [Phycisphaerales bacterium]